MVQGDLALILALAIQAAAIKGGGSNQPTGILGTSGIGDVAGGTNGAQPTFANLVALETAVATANADIGSLARI
jgi:HK97 family phage major capsid protein